MNLDILYNQVCLLFDSLLGEHHEYTLVGIGVASSGTGLVPNHVWHVGKAMGQGVKSCYEAVKLDRRCSMDYFTYVTRGDKNCGCKASTGALRIAPDNNADYFTINHEGMHKLINILDQ